MLFRTLILFVSIIGCLCSVQPVCAAWKFRWNRPFAFNLGRQEVGIGWSIVATLGAVGLAGYWIYKQLVSPIIVDKEQTFTVEANSSPVNVILRNYDCFTQFPVSETNFYESRSEKIKGRCRTISRKLEMFTDEIYRHVIDHLQYYYEQFFAFIVRDQNENNPDLEKRIVKIKVILKQQNASEAPSIIQKAAKQLVNAIGKINLPENLKERLTIDIDVCVHPEAFDIYQQAFTHKAQSSQSVVIRS
jgi:hypothetical protein